MAKFHEKLLLFIGDTKVNEWARIHDLPPQTVHGWLKDERIPRGANLRMLSEVTGRSPQWWLSDKDELSEINYDDGYLSDFLTNLKTLIGNMSHAEFAKKVGISESTIEEILAGTNPDVNTILKISKSCNVRLSWLIGNTDLEFNSPSKTINFIDESDKDKRQSIHIAKQSSTSYSNTLHIDSFPEVRAAAGEGQVSPTDQTVVQLKVNSADWRRYVGLDHKHVKIITVYGDSMKPTLSHGDQVMVDTACGSFIDDAIYCIQQGDNLRFKRIKLNLDGSIVVKSDNEKAGFPAETYSSDEAAHFHVIGRVIPLKFGWFEI